MKGLLTIYRREVAGLFLTPLAWAMLVLVLLYQGYFFLLILADKGGEVNASLTFLLGGGLPFWLLLLFLPPLLTMRMISEESRSGLLEFLLTAPVSDAAVVVGKALAATTFFAIALASTFLFAAVVQFLGGAPDWGLVFTAWLGGTLASGFFCALGLVSSALFSTPLLAAFFGILLNIALYALPILANGWRGAIGEALREALTRIDLLAHFRSSFMIGAIDSAHVVFFLTWTATALFLAIRTVESRRWLG